MADQENEHQKNGGSGGGGMANTLFHEQLREKHLYLEESIRGQQQQLQLLQQKLMTLANHGAGIYPMQMQLQHPLNKVMELQNRMARHREETQQQRQQLIDGGGSRPSATASAASLSNPVASQQHGESIDCS